MEDDDAFVHTYFTYLSQSCYDKGKEYLDERIKEEKKTQSSSFCSFMNYLQHLLLTEKNYVELGFLQAKHKGFLRKDNSLRAIYESMKNDLRKIEDNCKPNDRDRGIQNYCQNIYQFCNARISIIDLYEKIYLMGVNKLNNYNEMARQLKSLVERHALEFTNISLTPIKTVFSLEVEILEHLFNALTELQRLQFLPSLALIHGAHGRLLAWENSIQSRETWKLGFLKRDSLPALVQWLYRFKGAVLSKFSLYFHDVLTQQTTPSDMRHMCSKLQQDHYQKMFTFQRKYEAACVILLSDNQVSCDTADYDSFPIIVSYPPRSPPQLETILKLITDASEELSHVDRIVYKFSMDNQSTYIMATVEPNIYLVILFECRKSEKDVITGNFVAEFCTNLRCTKVFTALKVTGT